ncbi:hypothetical protein LTR49_027277 [Elasticomyces elasticus]|nr:hypothetical protein LTR49_027277 [Elasticomyces elasticus]
MDISPPHGFTKNGAFTESVYRDVYPGIDPKQSALSQQGKVILITGASRGIGKDGIAHAFALAGAKAIIVTARKLESLEDTEALIKRINSSIEVLPVALEVSSES